MRGLDAAAAMLLGALLGAGRDGLAEDLSLERALEQVNGCQLDLSRYRALWPRQDALLLNLPAGGALNGIVISQFYLAPGRNGGEGDYGLVLNAPVAQVAGAFPELAANVTVNGRQRRLVNLALETGNPRNRSQTLLVCRAGAEI